MDDDDAQIALQPTRVDIRLALVEEVAVARFTRGERIIGESHAEALRLLGLHPKELDALAEALLAHESLDEGEILSVTGLLPAAPLHSTKLST